MTPFVTIKKDEEPKDDKVSQADVKSDNAVQKAKEAAEIQKYETERIEAKRKAVFAENDIKDTDDLQTLLLTVKEKENKLAKDFMDFENKKATELSEVQKLKAEHEHRIAELVKREQDLATRTKNVEQREKLVTEREELMNQVEKKNLEDTITQNSLLERLKRNLHNILRLLDDNADTIDGVGFHEFADSVWADIDKINKWSKEDISKNCISIVHNLKLLVDDCNDTAVRMARSPQQYNESSWNSIVDNLENIYTLLPEIKPQYLPKED